jgi:hypothetical protein
MRRLRRLLFRSLLALLGCSAAAASEVSFAPLPGFERIRGARAVAADVASGRVAVGTSSSVWLAAPGALATRALRVGEVRDLAFAADGTLWVASARGVYAQREGAVREHALGAGASGRATRLLLADGAVLAGSEDGLWLHTLAAGAFARVNGSVPEGSVRALARSGSAVFVAFGNEVARVVLADGARSPTIARQSLPAGDGALIDLAAHADGRVVALRERALAVRDVRTGRWTRQEISLPPGVLPVRLAIAGDAFWIASDAGALLAPAVAGPYARAAAPAGSAAIGALALTSDAILLAGPRGILRGRAAAPSPPAPEPRMAAPAISGEPSVLAVQRAAQRYLALAPGALASLRARPRQSAYAPTFELFGRYVDDRERDSDHDETFTSGVDRVFRDRSRSHGRDYEVGAALHWDFGAAVYHPEEIDAAREAREWIELRDEVLDEIAQLYFERRRALLDAASEPDARAAARLRLRAEELGAGLDAWTGGWWSAALNAPSPRGSAEESLP